MKQIRILQIKNLHIKNLHSVLPLLGLGLVYAFFIPTFVGTIPTIPSVFPDGWISTWNVWWSNRQNLPFPEPLSHTVLLFHPFGTGLRLHTMVEGLVWPIANTFCGVPPATLFASLCLFSFAATYLLVYLAARSAQMGLGWGVFVALLLSLHPYFIGHLAGGHLNLIFVAPLIAVWVLVSGCIGRGELSRGRMLLLGAMLGYLPYIDLYSTYFTLVPLVVGGIVLGYERPLGWGGTLRRLGLACGLGLLLAAPKLLDVVTDMTSGKFTPNHNPARHSLDLAALFIPSEYQWSGRATGLSAVWEEPRREGTVTNSAESGGYVGIGMCAMLSVLLILVPVHSREENRRQRMLLTTASVGLLLSFGPQVRALGVTLAPNPLFYLGALLPAFPSVPARWFLVFLLSITLLLIEKLSNTTKRSRFVNCVAVALAAVITFEYFPAPLAVSSRAPEPELQTLRLRADVHAILDLSADQSLRMFRQMYHRKRIVGGFVARSPRKAEAQARRNKFIRFVNGGSTVPESEIRAGWRELKIEAVLVDSGNQEFLARLNSLSWLQRTIDGGSVVLYEVTAPS